jgi:hypothetical protein
MRRTVLNVLGALMMTQNMTSLAADGPQSLKWSVREVTVGPEKADVVGSDSRALQKAADMLAFTAPEGRGTLRLLPGTYVMRDSLHIRQPMKIVGTPGQTILLKAPAFSTTLAEPLSKDAVRLTVADASGLRWKDGITIRPLDMNYGWAPVVRTIIGLEGNTLTIDRPPALESLRGPGDFKAGAVVQSVFPLISCREVNDVEIEGLVIDGGGADKPDLFVDGCRNGGIYFLQGKDCAVRHCEVRNVAGDGISWQLVHNMTVENVESHHNHNYGFHPGTGSLNTVIKNCRSHHNGLGLFVCWNVRFGRFEDNVIEDNRTVGLSIGYNDTDNLFARNAIRRNAGGGILVNRGDGPPPDRNRFVENVIEDNGEGLRWGKAASRITLRGNVIRDTRPDGQKTQKTALYLHPDSQAVEIAPDNKIEGAVVTPDHGDTRQ